MGRNKIKIEPITEKKKRNVTFQKRKFGLFKKAMELSILCDCEIGLMIFKKGQLYEFGSKDINQLLQNYLNFSYPSTETYSNSDYWNEFDTARPKLKKEISKKANKKLVTINRRQLLDKVSQSPETKDSFSSMEEDESSPKSEDEETMKKDEEEEDNDEALIIEAPAPAPTTTTNKLPQVVVPPVTSSPKMTVTVNIPARPVHEERPKEVEKSVPPQPLLNPEEVREMFNNTPVYCQYPQQNNVVFAQQRNQMNGYQPFMPGNHIYSQNFVMSPNMLNMNMMNHNSNVMPMNSVNTSIFINENGEYEYTQGSNIENEFYTSSSFDSLKFEDNSYLPFVDY